MTTPAFTAAVALKQEWPSVRAIRLRSLSISPEAFGSTYEREVAFDDQVWIDRMASSSWVLVRNRTDPEVVAGVCCMRASSDDRTAELVSVFVEPESRGHGVGALPVRRALELARSRGDVAVLLWVKDVNHTAQRLYRTEGFQPTGRRRATGNNDAEHQWRVDLVDHHAVATIKG